jgi:hypothetical protein
MKMAARPARLSDPPRPPGAPPDPDPDPDSPPPIQEPPLPIPIPPDPPQPPVHAASLAGGGRAGGVRRAGKGA